MLFQPRSRQHELGSFTNFRKHLDFLSVTRPFIAAKRWILRLGKGNTLFGGQYIFLDGVSSSADEVGLKYMSFKLNSDSSSANAFE
jgi:hypothetical protein